MGQLDGEQIDLCRLRLGLSPRGLDDRHVALLGECRSALPPILVHRATLTVIDGAHRVHAARRGGHATIAVVWFDGTLDEAAVEAIRVNVRHGKPLTLDERRRAAKRLLLSDPTCSDRAVADICGLSPKTVGAVRSRATEEIPQSAHVVGKDGRRRPRQPDRSSSAPSRPRRTSVDGEQGEESSGWHPARTRALTVTTALADPRDGMWWTTDAALSARCPALVEWLIMTNPELTSWQDFLGAFPASRSYQLADEARRRAAIWLWVAAELDVRQSRS